MKDDVRSDCRSPSDDDPSGAALRHGESPAVNDRIRLLVVAVTKLYGEGLSIAMQQRAGVSVVAVGNQATALAHVAEAAPDVVAIDMTMSDALATVFAIRQEAAVKIVAYEVPDSERHVIECMEKGVHACVIQGANIEAFLDTVERAARDEVVLSPRIAAKLVNRLTAPAGLSAPAHAALTIREQRVLREMRAGLSNKEIAQSLHIAEATVKNHVHSILDKCGVRSRRQVMLPLLDIPPAGPR